MKHQVLALIAIVVLGVSVVAKPLIARGDVIDFLAIENESKTDVTYSIIKKPGVFNTGGCLHPKERTRDFHIVGIQEVKITLKSNVKTHCTGSDWQHHTIKYRAPDMTIKIDENSTIHT